MNAVERLQALNQQISAEGDAPRKHMDFNGQAWGGANCMVISNDLKTQNIYKDFDGEILSTIYAKEISNLYNSIKNVLDEYSGYNYMTKLELWGEITIAGRNFIDKTPSYNLTDLKLIIIKQAIEIVKKWQTNLRNLK